MSKLWIHDASNQAVLLFNHKLLSIFQLLKRFFCDGLYVCSIRWSQYYHQLRYFFTYWKWKGLGNILCTSPQSKPTENALKLYLVSPTTLSPTRWRAHMYSLMNSPNWAQPSRHPCQGQRNMNEDRTKLSDSWTLLSWALPESLCKITRHNEIVVALSHEAIW